MEVKSTSRFLLYVFIPLCGFWLRNWYEDNNEINLRSPGKAYVEGDASSASYFLAGAAVTGGTVTVEGCGTNSLQVFH